MTISEIFATIGNDPAVPAAKAVPGAAPEAVAVRLVLRRLAPLADELPVAVVI
jgi:hypothetical protein